MPASAAITIDGSFGDWSTVSTFASDPADATGNPETDFLTIKVTSDAYNLYLYYQTGGNFYLNATGFRYNVFFDTDQTATTGHKLFSSSAGGFDMLFQGATLFDFAGTDNTNQWNWSFIGGAAFGNSGNEAEFEIPLADLGLGPGVSLDFILYGDNTIADLAPNDYGSTSLTYTVVPEPSAFLLGAISLAGLLRRRR